MLPPFEDLYFDKSTYLPGEAVRLTVTFARPLAEDCDLLLSVWHLDEEIERQQHTLNAGEEVAAFVINPPHAAQRGYGVRVTWRSRDGSQAAACGAFDMLDVWTQHPRYGFVSDFTPGRADANRTAWALSRYHINGLQFYDWMYRHDEFLPPQDTFLDPLGRTLSLAATRALIAAAHGWGIAAMPYTAVYGASLDCYHRHPDWVLYDAAGQPVMFAGFLAVMDPRPGTVWTEHLLGQFDAILDALPFDGIHLDQYGEPKVGYDAAGNAFDLAEPLAALIDSTRQRVDQRRQGGAVIFNCVGNWPVEQAAPSGEDVVYIEIWPPYTRLADLHAVIRNAQRLGRGKPVVLAAYLDPAHAVNVQVVDAVIFASGAGHIELGENGRMLADPYFPKHQPVSPALADALRRLYDFAVCYQEVIGPGTVDGVDEWRVSIDGAELWPIMRRSPGRLAVSLINAAPDTPWQEPAMPGPQATGPVTVSVDWAGGETLRRVRRVWAASHDGAEPWPRDVAFTLNGGTVHIAAPPTLCWTLLVMEWE